MSTAMTNGHVSPTTERTEFDAAADHMRSAVADQVASMRALLHQEVAGREHLEQLLNDSKDREKRLQRAVDALEGTPARPAAKQPAAPAKPAKADRAVSPQRMEVAFAALTKVYEREGKAVTRTMVVEHLAGTNGAMSHGTCRKAFEQLRDDERVRIAGATRGGGKLWAPMPVASDVV